MNERRQTERASVFWETSLSKLSRNLTLKQLIDILDSQEWSYAFLAASDPKDQSIVLLHCGSDCARLLGLADVGARHVPPRHLDMFQNGLAEAFKTAAAVRRDGELRLSDGRRELFRVIFIPVELHEEMPVSVAFGTFNCRISER